MRAVNLIPAEQRAGAGPGVGRSEGAAYGVLALVGALALCAVLYGSARHEISSRRAQVATLTVQAQREQTAASQLAPYTSFIALREQRQQAVSALVDTRFDWAHVLHEFGRVLPFNTSISSLTGTIASPAAATLSSKAAAAGASSTVSSATPPGTVPNFTLAGCATSQSAVALMLERLRLIDGVNEVTLQSSTKGGASGSGAASSSGASGSGCPVGGPSFTVQVTFDPLPTPAASSSAGPSRALASSTGLAPTATGGAR
jgi:Tfp pilus assembly protein PilN